MKLLQKYIHNIVVVLKQSFHDLRAELNSNSNNIV